MPIRSVVATGGSTTSDGISPNPAITLARANAILVAGDTAQLQAGTYATNIAPANSGTAGNPITYVAATGATVTLNGKIVLSSRSYITVRGINRLQVATGTGSTNTWIDSNSNSNHCIVEYCDFHSTNASALTDPLRVGTPFPYVGIIWQGTDGIFRHNTIRTWYGGEALRAEGSNHHIHDNNCFNADCGHGIFHIESAETILERNIMRNRWARPFTVGNHSSDPTVKLGNLIQNNTIFDSNYDGVVLQYGTQMNEDPEKGDNALYKICGQRMIWRNNLTIASNMWSGVPDPWRSEYHFGNFDDANLWMLNQRVYHNTIYDSQANIVGVTYNTTRQQLATDNRFLNNVWHNQTTGPDGGDNQTVWMVTAGVTNGPANGQANYNYMDSWHFRNNLMSNNIRNGGGQSNLTVAQFAAAFPSLVSGNIAGSPTFVNSNYSASVGSTTVQPTRDNFLLASGLGKTAAMPVATAAQTSATPISTITVSDAYVFYPGYGTDGVAGDTIIHNGQTTTVTGVTDATHITVSPAITTTNGNPIWLEMFGVSPDLGIAADSVTTEIATPTLAHAEVSATAFGNAIASPTFAAPANGLLVVVASANGNGAGVTALPASIADTFAGSLTWTKYEDERGTTGSRVALAVFVAKTGLAPGSGTVTVTWTNTPGSKALNTVKILSGFATPPVAQFAVAEMGSGSSLTATLATAPEATSLALGMLAARGTSPNITPDPDATELEETPAGTNHAQQIQYILGNAAADMTWSGTLGVTGNQAIVLEIAEGEAVPTYEGSGVLLLPALTISGTGTHTPPIFEGSGDLLLPALTASGVGEFIQVLYSGSGTLILPALTAAGTGEHTPPIFSGSGDMTLPALTATGTGEHTPPIFEGNGVLTLPALSASGLGVFTATGTIHTGTGQLMLPALSASGLGTHTLPVYAGTGILILPVLVAAGAGYFNLTPPVRFVVTAQVEI